MHLKQLKLAGFKSFVDPTIIPFPSQLVAVVGPNGCGKSNIIDAVRWVMGESHAKHLRGESMADVIFKGSSNRKPVGQASVELIFDNSLGRLTGQYASYQEIAVKRLVTHDGESSYYLNGTRCRRRDITDIFLGTGAGARGYSIIGQDTISRLIEARPDDLRAYLEEAAGVSKYKERRRETLQRVHQTRENLARVADIREELYKQLQRLERQAKTAERYTELKQAERLCRADILALKWRVLIEEQQQLNKQSNQLLLQYEQYQTQSAAYLYDNELLREQIFTLETDMQHVQADFYQLATEIARLEEIIQQHTRDKQRIEGELNQLQQDLSSILNQCQHDTETLEKLTIASDELQQILYVLRTEFHSQQQMIEDDEQAETQWNSAWQAQLIELHQAERDLQIEQMRLQHLDERYQQAQLNFEKNQNEQASIDIDDLHMALAILTTQQTAYKTEKTSIEEAYAAAQKQHVFLREQLTDIEKQLRNAQDKLQSLAIEHATLLAAQNAVLKQIPITWPDSLPWDANLRVAEMMTVEADWLPICEQILGDGVQAIVLNSMDELWPVLAMFQGHNASFMISNDTPKHLAPYPRLCDKIFGFIPNVPHALEDIFAARDLTEALTWLPALTPQQSIVTLDGYWIAQHWVRVLNLVKDDIGVLSRQQALVTLNELLVEQQENVSMLKNNREHLHTQCTEQEQKITVLHDALMQAIEALNTCEAAFYPKQHALSQALKRQEILCEENELLQINIEEIALQRIGVENQRVCLESLVIEIEQQKKQLLNEKSIWETRLNISRQQLEEKRVSIHQTELQSNRDTLVRQQLSDNILRETQRRDLLQTRFEKLQQQLLALEIPDLDHKALLADKIMQHATFDAQLAMYRQQIAGLQQQLQEKLQLNKHLEQQTLSTQESRQQIELQLQTITVRIDALLAVIIELELNAAEVLANLPSEMILNVREQELMDLADKIKRLGPINLLAIEEYQQDLERKTHLDAQYSDLTDALALLDDAIVKMDKETEQRLQHTFDQVNLSFQTLFPRLFGGGYAKLELTCGNLLEAGILVMAQPPGKRNSSIHLLSGGEKAMTAVALVFAIFQLNPSPFCMLDEVDAPLDDANVRRFCALVKEMSEVVQFLFITHNKVTMELADHLIGVTMREPGVSRVVAVDVELVIDSAE